MAFQGQFCFVRKCDLLVLCELHHPPTALCMCSFEFSEKIHKIGEVTGEEIKSGYKTEGQIT